MPTCKTYKYEVENRKQIAQSPELL